MSLNWLEVSGIRNIIQARLNLTPKINLIVGANGSGKTSLLESVYFLGTARSFRNTSVTPMIARELDQCLVRGEVTSGSTSHRLGVLRKRDGAREIKIDGGDVAKPSDLANIIPTLVVGPETVNLLLGAPSLRRRFLNWGVFHVEQSFNQSWIEANRCLKQRNALLRQNFLNREKSINVEIDTWTQELIRHAQEIDRVRADYAEVYARFFLEHCKHLTDLQGVTIQYYRGWGADQSLAEIYENDRDIDQKRGYTTRGFHRADVRIRVNGQDVSSVCSRGELKVLSWAMVLSQGAVASYRSNIRYGRWNRA